MKIKPEFRTGDGVYHDTLNDTIVHTTAVEAARGVIISIESTQATIPPPNAGERSLHRWQYRQNGGFEHRLWECTVRADSDNLEAPARTFPEHLEAYRRYATESEYWALLKERIESE